MHTPLAYSEALLSARTWARSLPPGFQGARDELLSYVGSMSSARGDLMPSASTAPFSATTYSPARLCLLV